MRSALLCNGRGWVNKGASIIDDVLEVQREKREEWEMENGKELLSSAGQSCLSPRLPEPAREIRLISVMRIGTK